jgi:hypothetical protein
VGGWRGADAANELGIQVLDAEVLAENRQMIQVFRGCGCPVKVHSFPGVELVELRTSRAAKSPKTLEPPNKAA